MKYFINILLLFSLLLVSNGCAGKEKVEIEDSEVKIIPEKIIKEIKHVNHNPFYPLKDKIEDIEFKINELNAQILEYESSLIAPSINSEILKLVKTPKIEHEIIINNGTIIQGKIIQENADYLIVQTRIGQLKIDKFQVSSIEEIEPLKANIIFNEISIEEKISQDNLTFSGSLINNGSRRADFVRVVYYLWEKDTNPALADSVFINGNTIIFNNGVISDTSLNPGDSGNFNLSIDIPDSLNITYWTKEVKYDMFE
tara:strand:+ start:552 stop:1319 length:768 start_codon:yes stop_codon:yes gene_type:complete